VTVSGILSLMLGMVVLIGWYYHNTSLIQINPAFVPMQYNTALGFLLSGMALLFMNTKCKKATGWLGSAVFFIGLITLLEYVFGIDLFLDQLFMKHYVTVQSSSPGRMAPNTALCFTLTGFTAVYFTLAAGKGYAAAVTALVGALIFGLGVVAFTGYFLDMEAVYGWGTLTRMAIHTATGFMIIGSGYTFLSWKHGNVSRFNLPPWLSFPILIVSLTFTVSIWQAIHIHYGNLATQFGSEYTKYYDDFILIFGILFSMALAFSIHRTILARSHLEGQSEAQRALHESGKKISNLMESLPIGISVSTPEGDVLEVNPAMLKIFGYASKKEFFSVPAETHYYNSKDREQFVKLTEQGLAKGIEIQFKHKDGSVFWGSMTSVAVPGKADKVELINAIEDITERRRAENALKRSEERYRKLFDSTYDALMTLHPPTWQFTSGNTAIVKIFKVKSTEEFLALHPWDISPEKQPDGRLSSEKAEEMIEIAMTKGSNAFEWTHKRMTGETFPATVLLTRIQLDDEIFLQAAVRDISRRKQTEEALKASEELYRRVVQDQTEFIMRFLPDGTRLFVNKSYCDAFNTTPEQAIGKTFFKDIPRATLLKLKKKIAALTPENSVITDEHESTTLDGKQVWHSWTDRGIFDEKGVLQEIQAVGQDITERKQAEKALSDSQESLRFLSENTEDVLYRLRFDTMKYDYLSPSITKLVGYTAQEINKIGFKSLVLQMVYPQGKTEISLQDQEDARMRGETAEWQGEYRVKTKSGDSKWVFDHSYPWKDETGKTVGSVGIMQDITVRRQAEEALQYRVEFERLITGISTFFINIAPHGVDNGINQTLHEIGNFAEVDRSYVFLFPDNGEIMNNTNEWCADGIKPQIDNLQGIPFEALPWWMKKLSRFECIHIPRVADLPPEASAEKKILQEQDILSLIVIPIISQKSLIGFLGFDSVKREKTWSEDVISLLRIVGDIIASAIERMQAEEKLLESQKYAQNLIDSSLDIIIAVDSDRRIMEFNKAAEEYFGYSKIEVLGKPADFLYVDVEQGKQIHEVTLEKGRHVREVKNRRKNGEIFTALLSTSTLTDEQGNLVGIMGVSRDITEQRRSEELTRDLGYIIADSLNEVYLFDAETLKFIMVNKGAQVNLGYSAKEILDLTPLDIKPLHDLTSFRQLLKPLKAGDKQKLQFETIHRRKDGSEYPVDVVLQMTTYMGKAAYLAMITDITERHNQEETQLQLEAQLRQSQKLEAVGTMAGGIAHDFNNILQGLYLYSGIIKDQLPDDAELRSNFQHIIDSGERAKELVKQILTFSREKGVELKPVKLQYLIKDALKLTRAATPSTIQITESIDANCAPVLCDVTQVHQVFVNLCNNAVYAMQEKGGTLSVSLRQIETQIDTGSVNTAGSEEGFVELVISDTGQGMDAETLEMIYDPFFTTKEVGEGTGLGLSIVHGIITDMHGQIKVSSEPGKGTTFRILIPVGGDQTEPEIDPKKLTKSVQSLRILFVDDDEMISGASKIVLEREGYQVTVANDGQEALELFQKDSRAYNLIITDLTMPKMTGLELGRKVRKLSKEVLIVLTSGNLDRKLKTEFESLGFNGFIRKPWTAPEMATMINSLISAN